MPWFTKKERRMQVSAFPAIFKADFGRFRRVSAYFGRIGRRPIRPDMANTARFWPNQPGSTWIEADSARIEPHRRESSRVGANPRKKKKKKKKTQTRSDARATASRIGRRCGTSGAASMLSRLFLFPLLDILMLVIIYLLQLIYVLTLLLKKTLYGLSSWKTLAFVDHYTLHLL